MHSSIMITKAAPDKALVTLYEAKVSLRLPTNGTTNDELLKFAINRASDEVNWTCARDFAYETVIEKFHEILNPITRLYLSRYPVKPEEVVSIDVNNSSIDPATYEVDEQSGKVTILGGIWAEDVTVTYSGGYKIPQGVPPALRQACLLLTREAYYSSLRGDPSVRSITHKESRIMYFDPNAALKGSAGAGGGTPAAKAAEALLFNFMKVMA